MTPAPAFSARVAVVAANLLTLAIALQHYAGVDALLWPYYVQNLLIGGFTAQRMLAARTGDAFWRKLATSVFIITYGLVHAVYWIFLRAVAPWQTSESLLITAGFFAFAQLLAWRRQRLQDQGVDATTLLLVIPFFRVFLIRGMVLFGALLLASVIYRSPREVLIALATLKTAADWFALDAEATNAKVT